MSPETEGASADDHDVGRDPPRRAGARLRWLSAPLRALHHTSHSRTKLKQVLVKTARQMQHPASQASKEDDMNGHRECCVQTFARGV